MEIKINELACKRCGHRWIPRKSDVRTCPHCKTAYWDTAKPKAKKEDRNESTA